MAERSHARPGSRFLDPLVLARIDNLDLLARTVVEGFIGGLHRSPYRGLSVDFAEHRPYMPGDDIRLIDWRVYGRTDRFYIKQFEVDSNTNFTVLLDVSRSMAYRHPDSALSKLDYGRYLAACLTYFAHKQRDRVGFVSFADDVVDYVPPAAKHRDLILHTIDRLRPEGTSDLDRPLLKVAEASRRRGIMVLISDLYEEPVAVRDAIQRLGHKGNDLIVFHLLDRAEVEFPFEDAANYRDMETGKAVPVMPDKLRDQYRQMIREHLAALESSLGMARIDYTMLDTAGPLDHALYTYLSLRQRLTRIR